MKTQRIIGVDFGTSTSVIRVKRYQAEKPVGDRLETKSVTFNMGSTMVPTLIQKLSSGESAFFGYDAEIPHKNTVTVSNFKVDIENPDETIRSQARKNTQEFFEYLAKNYKMQSESGHLGEVDDEEKTMISYPVKWSGETKEFMVETARNAGFPNVEGIDEAQAAIRAVTVQNMDLLSRKGYMKTDDPLNILLIDMGAGTTDLVLCRYTPRESSETEILVTWPNGDADLFGGREIDDLLKNYISQYIPEEYAAMVLKKIGMDKYKAWKETIVSPALKKKEAVDYFAALDDLLDMLDIESEYSIDRESFENFAADYIRKFPVLVNDCINASEIKSEDVDLVILTGGHSQWYFVPEILSGNIDKFGTVNLEKIRKDPERIISIALPQETVALGLAYRESKKEKKSQKEKESQKGQETLTYLNGISPTCTKDGRLSCWYRSSDGTFYADEEGKNKLSDMDVKLPALGHAFEGIEVKLEKDRIPNFNRFIIDHEYIEWVHLKREKKKVCKRCGAMGSSIFVDVTKGYSHFKSIPCSPERDFKIILHGKDCGIKKYLGNDAIVVIPPEIDGHKVVQIEEYAFAKSRKWEDIIRCQTLICVVIPETVQNIEEGAFFYCNNLYRVMAHEKIKKIDRYAFSGCREVSVDFGPKGPKDEQLSDIVFFQSQMG